MSRQPIEDEAALAAQRLLESLEDAEKECCPFLRFDVREQGGEISVELRYAPEFADTLAQVLSGVREEQR